MRSRRILALLALPVLGLALAPGAGAATIYSTFGHGDTFSGGGWLIKSGNAPASSFVVAPGADFRFESAELALSTSFAGEVTIRLHDDSGGVPGVVLETFTLDLANSAGAIHGVTSTLTPVLSSGETYWISTIGVGGYTGAWNWSPAAKGLAYTFAGAGQWAPYPTLEAGAFRVNGVSLAAVPEPASLAMAGLGILGVAGLAIRRRMA